MLTAFDISLNRGLGQAALGGRYLLLSPFVTFQLCGEVCTSLLHSYFKAVKGVERTALPSKSNRGAAARRGGASHASKLFVKCCVLNIIRIDKRI